MVYFLKQRHSVLWIFHATHHVKETKNNDRCNISLNKCPHSNEHPLAKKSAHPKATKSNKHPTKKSPPLLPILGKPLQLQQSQYRRIMSVPLDLVPSF